MSVCFSHNKNEGKTWGKWVLFTTTLVWKEIMNSVKILANFGQFWRTCFLSCLISVFIYNVKGYYLLGKSSNNSTV